MERFEILPWDSEFFGFTVARITADRLTEELLAQMQQRRVMLAYWSSDTQPRRGFLADRKVTYAIALADANATPPRAVEEYTDSTPDAELEALAVAAGGHSRFRVDPRIGAAKCDELYRLWIRNSTSKQLADAVFVVRNAGRIVGMITVRKIGDVAHIGLVATDAAMRGQNVGVSLVCAAHDWARRESLRRVEVVTQQDNAPACRLYEKCGYRVARVEHVYHLWMDDENPV